MIKRLFAVAVGLWIAIPASAADLVTLNWTGTIYNSSVQTSPSVIDHDLNGLLLNVVFTIDTRKGTLYTQPNYQGIGYSGGDPGESPVSALVTIGSQPTRSVDGSYLAEAQVYNDYPSPTGDNLGTQVYERAVSQVGAIVTYHTAFAGAYVSDPSMMLIGTGSLSAPVTATPDMLKYLAVDFTDYVRDQGTGEFLSYTRTFAQAQSISLSQTSVPVSDVPEPSSWMLMIAGMGITGSVLRRRKRVSLAPR